MNGTARLQLPKKKATKNNKKLKSETNNENEVQAINYPRSHIPRSVCKLDFAVVCVEKKRKRRESGSGRSRRTYGRQ